MDYLIVKNSISNPSDFSCCKTIRKRSVPAPGSASHYQHEYRAQDIEQVAREHGVTMQAVADKKVDAPG